MRFAQLLGIYCLLSACGGESLDVGKTDDSIKNVETGGSGGTGGTEPLGTPLPEWPAADVCVAGSELPVVGVWEGAVQDQFFQDVIPLRVELLGASERDGVCGRVRWSEGDPLPAPTEPRERWPDDPRLGFGGNTSFMYEGHTYTMLDGGARADQVRFRITAAELWRPWCELQTSSWHPNRMIHSCLPPHDSLENVGTDFTCVLHEQGGSDIILDPGVCQLCYTQVCTCNSERCVADPRNVHDSLKFDLRFDAESAIGVVTGLYGYSFLEGRNYADVFLTRVEP